jgi:hypothetical protein
MRKLAGWVGFAALVVAVTGGCAAQTGDGSESTEATSAALTCEDRDPVIIAINHGYPHYGTCLSTVFPTWMTPEPTPYTWAQIYAKYGATTPRMACLVKMGSAYCKDPTITNVRWACPDDGLEHMMVQTECRLPQDRMEVLVAQCDVYAESFSKAPDFPPLADPTTTSYLAFDPAGSGPKGQ